MTDSKMGHAVPWSESEAAIEAEREARAQHLLVLDRRIATLEEEAARLRADDEAKRRDLADIHNELVAMTVRVLDLAKRLAKRAR